MGIESLQQQMTFFPFRTAHHQTKGVVNVTISKGNQREDFTAAGKLFCRSLGIGDRGIHDGDRSFLNGAVWLSALYPPL